MLQLFIADKNVILDDDVSIDIEVASPIWNPDVSGAFAYEFEIDIEANRHIFGTSDQIHGDSIYMAVDGEKFLLIANGIPMYSGVVKLDDEVEIKDGKVGITLVSGNREFSEIISDMSCRDVDISDDEIILGEAVQITMKSDVYRRSQDFGSDLMFVDGFGHETVDIPLSKEFLITKDYANVSLSYSQGAKFCNTRLCWQKQTSTTENGQTTHYKTRGYDVMEYNEQGSAPLFYVGYWLDKLFAQIGEGGHGIPLVSNELGDIEDYNRLAFMNTNPCFEIENGNDVPIHFAHCHPKYTRKEYVWDGLLDEFRRYGYDTTDCHYVFELPINIGAINTYYRDDVGGDEDEDHEDLTNINLLRQYIPNFDVKNISTPVNNDMFQVGFGYPANFSLHFYFSKGLAKATSENFPDQDVSDVIDAIQGMFCSRLLFDSNNRTARIVLMKNILSDTDIIDVPCIVHDSIKKENNIKGFRLKYSSASDTKEEEKAKDKIAYYNEKDIDTSYNYHDFTNVAFESYERARSRVRIFEKHTFYNDKTGNTYVVKVDKEAENAEELFPSLIEVVQFNTADYGDCKDESFIKTTELNFQPVSVDDVNGDTRPQTNRSHVARYAVFIDADIYGKETVYAKDNSYINDSYYNVIQGTSRSTVDVILPVEIGMSFTANHNYDRSNGESPLVTKDFGLSFGVMRGPGSNGGTVVTDVNYDNEGNSKWQTVAGDYAFHFDTHDDYGNIFDYNGTAEGVGAEMENRFSLRLRAEKPNPAYDPNNPSETVTLPNGLIVPNTPFFPIEQNAAKRGLFDKFYALYVYWLTHHKTVTLDCTIELAVLKNLDLTKHHRFGEYVGFINKINYSIEHQGMSNVKVELFYL